jgi:hypothetical protein
MARKFLTSSWNLDVGFTVVQQMSVCTHLNPKAHDQEDRQCTYNVTLCHDHEIIIVVEKQ